MRIWNCECLKLAKDVFLLKRDIMTSLCFKSPPIIHKYYYLFLFPFFHSSLNGNNLFWSTPMQPGNCLQRLIPRHFNRQEEIYRKIFQLFHRVVRLICLFSCRYPVSQWYECMYVCICMYVYVYWRLARLFKRHTVLEAPTCPSRFSRPVPLDRLGYTRAQIVSWKPGWFQQTHAGWAPEQT